MLECYKNIRQTNEKIEECISEPKEKLNYFYKEIENIYKKNEVKMKLTLNKNRIIWMNVPTIAHQLKI